jgi:transcriptional regulator with XRE-family HTH domain
MRLRDWLDFNKMSQTDLAKLTGISQSLISKYVYDERSPGKANLLRLKAATHDEVGEADWPLSKLATNKGRPRHPWDNGRGYLYFVLDTTSNLVKIGCTLEDPYVRVANGQSFNPNPLVLLGFFETNRSVEARLHVILSSDRVVGEWFKPGRELRGIIAEHCPNARVDYLLADDLERLELRQTPGHNILVRVTGKRTDIVEVVVKNGMTPRAVAEKYSKLLQTPVTVVEPPLGDGGGNHEDAREDHTA